jgi:nifR3 family TIM-barrel protein
MGFTEVANAEATWRGGRQTLHLLETFPGERPVAAHLYGSNPDSMARAAGVAEKMGRFDTVDINCGCPVRRVVAKGAGGALMRDPRKIGQIVKAVRSAVSLPVTVKTRIGLAPDKVTVFEVAREVEEAGAAALFVHARFMSNRHSGPADWALLAKVKSACRIPVIGNGGIDRPEDAAEMVRQTGVDGVMIGRGAVGNPWFFREVRQSMQGLPVEGHGTDEHRRVILEHLSQLIHYKEVGLQIRRKAGSPAEEQAVLEFRPHLVMYLKGRPGYLEFKRSLSRMRRVEHVMEALDKTLGAEGPIVL